MNGLFLDTANLDEFVKDHELTYLQTAVTAADQLLREKSGPGKAFLGWLDWPQNYDQAEFLRIKQAAEQIRADSEVLIVLGIGGSYLGARAVIELLQHSFQQLIPHDKTKSPQIIFAGNSLSAKYLAELSDIISERDFSLNIISKSGTTTEPAIAFRILKDLLYKKYGKKAGNQRIYATTDRSHGAVKTEALAEGWQTFIIPDDIGGRFTVLTPAGLLPIAVAGADISALLLGAARASQAYSSPDLTVNDAYKYAAIRNILYRKGKDIELLVNFEPSLHYFSEWWKQLFGESEGKDLKGIFPASADFSTDLHSLGQYIQAGQRNIFETVLQIRQSEPKIQIPPQENDLDGLDYLVGKDLNFINEKACEGTLLAHTDGQVPNMSLKIEKIDENHIGQMIYFFEIAVAISGYLNGINPFDQPGVEAYKKNMFALLGKPGFEELAKELNERL